jgi:hypothetical protein
MRNSKQQNPKVREYNIIKDDFIKECFKPKQAMTTSFEPEQEMTTKEALLLAVVTIGLSIIAVSVALLTIKILTGG